MSRSFRIAKSATCSYSRRSVSGRKKFPCGDIVGLVAELIVSSILCHCFMSLPLLAALLFSPLLFRFRVVLVRHRGRAEVARPDEDNADPCSRFGKPRVDR